MLIGKGYKVETDAMNVTIMKRGVSKKTGKETWANVAYFSTFENALEYLVDLKVRETGLRDLQSVVEKQKELYSLIRRLNRADASLVTQGKPLKA